MIVRELITRMGFGLDQGSVSKVEQATNRVKNQAEEAAAAFRNVVVAIASFATVRSIIAIGDEMQSVRTRIGQLPQTVGEVGAAFDMVVDHANAAGQKVEAYSALYTRVGHAAKDYIKTQEDLLGITDTISQALVVGGANTQEASSAMIQFSQALASGVLQGDEFRSMAEAAPQYLDKLSETMKIPREQLKKMASDGKLTAKAVIEATRKMGDYFEDRFNQMPMTVGRAITVVGNRFARMIDRMNRGSNFITVIANAILAGFDKIEAGVMRLVDAFGGWGNLVRFVGILIATAFGAKALSILAAFRAASLLALLPFLKIIAIITLVALAVEDLYVWINGGESVMGRFLGPWEEWRPYVLATLQMAGDALSWFWGILVAVGKVIWGLFTLNPELFKAGLTALTSMLWEKMVEWGKLIYKAFFDPIVQAITDAWNAVAGRFGKAWELAKTAVGYGTGSAGATGGAMTPANMVAPAQMAGPAMGTGATVVNSPTTVTVTVPPGTPQEQASFLQNVAQKSFEGETNSRLARHLSVYAP